jgi:hypothetical protein
MVLCRCVGIELSVLSSEISLPRGGYAALRCGLFGSILQSSVWLRWLYFGVRSLLCVLMSSKGSRLFCDLNWFDWMKSSRLDGLYRRMDSGSP